MALTSSSMPKAVAPQGPHWALAPCGASASACSHPTHAPIQPWCALGSQGPKPLCAPPFYHGMPPCPPGAREGWGSGCLSRAGRPSNSMRPCRHRTWAEEPAIFQTPTHGCKIHTVQPQNLANKKSTRKWAVFLFPGVGCFGRARDQALNPSAPNTEGFPKPRVLQVCRVWALSSQLPFCWESAVKLTGIVADLSACIWVLIWNIRLNLNCS